MDHDAEPAAAAILREALTRENRAVAAVVPVLRHLLVSDAQALMSDAVIARVRGMVQDCAAQLLAVVQGQPAALLDPAELDAWAALLLDDATLLKLCHALAHESLLAERFQQWHAIDPVLSPLLQELIASEDPATASLAMGTLAAQSRFMQSQRRMALPLTELPAELFHTVVALGRRGASAEACERLTQLQQTYDEGASRLGLLSRLVAGMRRAVVAALALDHAGLALFATALASQSRQSREACVLACHEGQTTQLALTLRAAGLPLAALERQLLLMEPAAQVPRAINTLSADGAAALIGADAAV